MRRHAKVDDDGHYSLRSLPMGIYEVALDKDGKTVDTRRNVKLTVGGGSEVDFACEQDRCAKARNN